jgi:KipI family sensor histidine kinase inhibitor
MSESTFHDLAIVAAGDSAFSLRCCEKYSPTEHERLLSFLAALERTRPPTVLDLIAGHTEILVIFDPAAPDVASILHWIKDTASTRTDEKLRNDAETLRIPVCFDPDFAIDLPTVASQTSMSPNEVIELFTNASYRCTVVGFRPGFPYLEGLCPQLTLPRRPTPRTRVPQGAVAIAGSQAGIYPVSGPGGWHVLGRTPMELFDPKRAEPSVVRPGTRVQFYKVDRSVFSPSSINEHHKDHRSQR